jgi:tetratricopeptide (TPR) repeat protein
MRDGDNQPELVDQTPEQARRLARQGERHRLLGNDEAALADFNQAVNLKPDYAWALAHRGLLYKQRGKLQVALADFSRAIDLKPDYAWAFIHRANLWMMIQDYEQALADLDQALSFNQTIIPRWQGERGLILNALGRYAETMNCCQPALRADPADYVALYSFVVARVLVIGPVEARPELSQAQRVLQTLLHTAADNETRAGLLYRQAGLAALQGDRPSALASLQQAVFLDDEPGEIARHDPAWQSLRLDPDFQSLITKSIKKVGQICPTRSRLA